MRELDDPRGMSVPIGNLARMAAADGDLATAETLASESLALAQEGGDLDQVHMSWLVGWLWIQQGRTAEAVEREREVIQLADNLQSKDMVRRCCEDLTFVLARQGVGASSARQSSSGRHKHST